MDKLDYAILNVLQENQCFRRIQSITRNSIMDVLEVKKVTLHRRLNQLLISGYIANGLLEGREHTYYITDTGSNLLEEELG